MHLKLYKIVHMKYFIDFYVLLYLGFTMMTSCEISYSSVTTTADDVIEFTNLTRLTCKLKLDWNSISHQPGVKEVYSLPKYLCFLPSHLFHSFSLVNMVIQRNRECEQEHGTEELGREGINLPDPGHVIPPFLTDDL